jgi:hypothetical protein
MAALAILSFGWGAIVYGGELSALKTIVLCMLLFTWFVVIPIVKGFRESVHYPSKYMQAMSDFQLFSIRCVFPFIIIGAFAWLTFTSWKHTWDFGLREFLHEAESKEAPVRQ